LPGGCLENVRERRYRQSETNLAEPEGNYFQSETDQVQPGNHQEEPKHHSEKSGDPGHHRKKSEANSCRDQEVTFRRHFARRCRACFWRRRVFKFPAEFFLHNPFALLTLLPTTLIIAAM
jgi:hypothetical protein